MQAYSGGWAEGLERGEAAITNTATNMLELQQRAKEARSLSDYRNREVAIQEENSALQRQGWTTENALNRIKLTEARKQEEQMNRIVDLNTMPGFSSLPDQIRQNMIQFTHGAGLTDDQGKGTVRNFMTALKLVESDSGLYQQMMQPVVDYKKQVFTDAQKKLDDAMASGDQKKIAQLQTRVQSSRTAYLSSLNGYGQHLMKLQEIQAQSGNKNQSTEQLINTMFYDPNPKNRARAKAIYDKMQSDKQAVAAANAGGIEAARQEADKKLGMEIVKENHLGERLANGITSPSQISQSFRQPFVRLFAVTEARKINPNYNEMEADANFNWYKAPGTQRLIRRTESIVAPGGAADEAIRFAKLVNNPAGTPLNKLTGKAKVMFGNSKRALLDLVQGMSSEEVQQIMGSQGGGERFLQFTQELNDPNLSVEQYVNNVNELKYLVLTRQVANTKGTPAQDHWQKLYQDFKNNRPYSAATNRTIIRTGIAENGRKVVQYSDGRIEYAH